MFNNIIDKIIKSVDKMIKNQSFRVDRATSCHSFNVSNYNLILAYVPILFYIGLLSFHKMIKNQSFWEDHCTSFHGSNISNVALKLA